MLRLVAVVLLVVRLHEPVRVAPNGLEDARPGITDADIAGFAAAGLRHHFAVLVEDLGKDPKDRGPATARLHRIERGKAAAEEAAVLGLPPGVDDDRLALAHRLVVPAPDVRFDRFAHRRHVLEVVVVLLWLVRTDFAQRANRRRGRVERCHAQALGDAPGPSRVGIGGDAFVHHRSSCRAPAARRRCRSAR